MIQDFANAGYRVICREMDASKLGLPYERKRAIVVGIEKESYSRLGVFALPRAIKTSVGKAIAKKAFPHHSFFKTRDEKEILSSGVGKSKEWKPSKRQRAYDSWAEDWVRKHDLKAQKDQCGSTWKPIFDLGRTFGLTTGDIIQKWGEAGFNSTIEDEPPTPTKGAKNEKLHLSIPILRRLQGLPDDWHIAGSNEEQAKQLMDFSPPIVSFIIGRKLHEALTNRPSDLSNPLSYEILSGRRQRRPVIVSAPQPRRLFPPMPVRPLTHVVEGYPRNGGPEIDDNPRAVPNNGTINLIGPYESSHPQKKLADEWRQHVDDENERSEQNHLRNGEYSATFMT